VCLRSRDWEIVELYARARGVGGWDRRNVCVCVLVRTAAWARRRVVMATHA
jgi:hypothetical protein